MANWLASKKRQYYSQIMVIINHILYQIEARIDCEKLVTDEKKTRYIDEMVKQVDRKQEKLLLNALANQIKKETKSKTIKN